MSVKFPITVAAGEVQGLKAKVQSVRDKRNIEHRTLNIERRSGRRGGNGDFILEIRDFKISEHERPLTLPSPRRTGRGDVLREEPGTSLKRGVNERRTNISFRRRQ
jgi:hypothetical protein